MRSKVMERRAQSKYVKKKAARCLYRGRLRYYDKLRRGRTR